MILLLSLRAHKCLENSLLRVISCIRHHLNHLSIEDLQLTDETGHIMSLILPCINFISHNFSIKVHAIIITDDFCIWTYCLSESFWNLDKFKLLLVNREFYCHNSCLSVRCKELCGVKQVSVNHIILWMKGTHSHC